MWQNMKTMNKWNQLTKLHNNTATKSYFYPIFLQQGSYVCSYIKAMYQQIQGLNTEEKGLEISKSDVELFKTEL